jgi:hypothetical protein
LLLLFVTSAIQDLHVALDGDREIPEATPGSGRVLGKLRSERLEVLLRSVDRDDPIRDFTGLKNRLRGDPRDVDRDVVAITTTLNFEAAIHSEDLTVVVERLTSHDHIEDIYVFPKEAEWFLER